MNADTSYHWIDDWITVPDSPTSRENGRTHGVAVTGGGNIIVFHQAMDGLLTYSPDGELLSAVGGERWLGAHGQSLHRDRDGRESLWLVDEFSGEIAQVTLQGETMLTLEKPDHPAYANSKYIPTWADQHPETGEIWTADGYGASLLHRYSPHGRYLKSYDGADSGIRFACPHGIRFVPTAAGWRLYVADRTNERIAVLDEEGIMVTSATPCHSPCGFDYLGDQLLVPELFTGVKVLDIESLEVLHEQGASGWVGPNDDPNTWFPPRKPEGWPNLKGTEFLQAGWFSSPHAAAFDPSGNIYVVEWIQGGGRVSKLEKRK